MEGREEDRWIIQISEFARINYPNLWDHGRNPVRYASLEELGIDPSALKWEPMPQPVEGVQVVSGHSSVGKSDAKPLTMAEAKKGLALTFQCPGRRHRDYDSWVVGPSGLGRSVERPALFAAQSAATERYRSQKWGGSMPRARR